MTIAAKINIASVCAALLLVCLVTAYFAQREYQFGLDLLVQRSSASVANRSDLPFFVYDRDRNRLKQLLGTLTEPAAVSFALAYDSEGKVLANTRSAGTELHDLVSLQKIRGDVSVADIALNSWQADGSPVNIGFWTSLFNREPILHLTLPIFSLQDPTRGNLRLEDFYPTAAGQGTQRSLVVIGYIQEGISRQELFDDIRPHIIKAFVVGLLLALLCVGALALLTRRFTRPIVQLAQLARNAVSGELDCEVKISGGKEFEEIEKALRDRGSDADKRDLAQKLDHQLLSLKAVDSASKLSKRNEELDKATQQISQTKSQLHKLTFHDSITALPNRRMFTEQLALLLRLNQRNERILALVLINLDNYQQVNESLGHKAGDLMLQEAGKRLSECLRDSDLVSRDSEPEQKIGVSRLGGDEFAVVLSELVNVGAASVVAKRLIDALVKPMNIAGQEVVISPSVGIAIAPDHAFDMEGIERAAGTAMHHARLQSQEAFLFYNSDMKEGGVNRLKLESDLRKAIERKQLVLHYQPQVDMVSGSVVSAEALLRWQHPEHGLMMPQEFIAVAEQLDLMTEFGDWVLGEACRQVKEFQDKDIKLPRVAINVSPAQFNEAFVTRVKSALVHNELPASALELGLPEAMFRQHNDTVAQCLTQLKELGVYLSVDDFGTGYAPLDFLTHYKVDEIKVDRRFVAECDSCELDGNLVIAIIGIAKSLNLQLVAEGVETQEQQHFLRKHGAKIMRGYLFSPAVSSQQLEPLLVPWHFIEQAHHVAE